MSDLQISLLAIGAVIVAGVYLFNLRQERQLRRRTEQAFAREHPDVLLGQVGDAGVRRVEPTINADSAPATPAVVPAVTVRTAAAIDPVIDYVVEVVLPAATPGAGLQDDLRALMAECGKSVLAEGYDERSGDWVAAGDGSAHARLRFGLQISNRSGCVTLGHLAAFRDAVLAWAGVRGGETKALDIDAVHAMAVQLDRFCADVDIAIGINVVTADGSPFTGTRIRAVAEKMGLELGPEGVFHARNDAGETAFTLDNHEPMPFVPEQLRSLNTRGVTFLLDVPRVTS
ncbi:MAG: hypothetical protein IT509_13260, partial [Rhodocyclaceae bacterium]|nr:hypothetical protein [Rhodocyclaceae bacterium]